ncbi:MAG TPA: hypothetical protein P5204_00570 [Kiritimatiellia bacterium]|nr:hypothetical protein [Kiritimatiellia bacterium]
MFSTNGLSALTLVALLLLLAVVSLQAAEISYYSAVPSIWP